VVSSMANSEAEGECSFLSRSKWEETWVGPDIEVMGWSTNLTLRRRFCATRGFSMTLALSEGGGGWGGSLPDSRADDFQQLRAQPWSP